MFCSKCATSLPDDAQFCLKCGHALTGTLNTNIPTTPSPEAKTEPLVTPAAPTDAPTVSMPNVPNANIGTFVFASFAVLSLVVSFVKGVVPIFIIEAGLWGGLAWYWNRKKPKSQAATAIVLLLAVVVVAAEGYSLLRKFEGPNYTYLQQGNAQYRVDNAAGRTDRLTSTGWTAVSFDRPPEPIVVGDLIFGLTLNKGEWDPILKQICFDASNNSDFVLQNFTIIVSLNPKPADDNPFDDIVTLKGYGGGLLDKGKSSLSCGPAPKTYPAGSTTWSYVLSSGSGWKE
jgi:hypothetical protein